VSLEVLRACEAFLLDQSERSIPGVFLHRSYDTKRRVSSASPDVSDSALDGRGRTKSVRAVLARLGIE
jgi:hypothetical protein